MTVYILNYKLIKFQVLRVHAQKINLNWVCVWGVGGWVGGWVRGCMHACVCMRASMHV